MFELSKLLSFFLTPSNIMVILGLAGIALLTIGYARAGRWLLVGSIVLITATGVLPIGTGLALSLEARFPPWDATRKPPTGIIVLGGGVFMSEISAERGVIATGPSVNRIIAAVELARRYPDARIVFAGTDEANYLIPFVEKLGVSKDRVIVEMKSRNTFENAAFLNQRVMPKPGERWALVTSAMHMPRAVGVFRKAGFAVDAYPVDYLTSGAKDLWTLRGALMGGIGTTDLAVHEWIGLLFYWITGRISVPYPRPMSDAPDRSSRPVTFRGGGLFLLGGSTKMKEAASAGDLSAAALITSAP